MTSWCFALEGLEKLLVMCTLRIFRNLLLVIVMQLAGEMSASGEPCPKGWQQKDDKCFYVSDQYASFRVAKKKCDSMTSELAPVYSLEDLSRLTSVLDDASQLCNPYENCVEFWIGVSDSTAQNQWTSTDGTLIPDAHKFWGTGYPKENGRCVLVDFQSGKKGIKAAWKNDNCARVLKYICSLCPHGFQYVPEIKQCLYLNLDRMTWDNARDACAEKKAGVILVSIKDYAKQEAVAKYLQSEFVKSSDYCEETWIGARRKNDKCRNMPYLWEGLRGPEANLRFSFWHQGQPDCSRNAEHCACITKHWDFKWNDMPCITTMCSLCETPKY